MKRGFMDREIELKLLEIEDVMAKAGANARKNVWETIDILMEKYPHYSNEILENFEGLRKKYDIDFFNEIRVTGKEINEHLK